MIILFFSSTSFCCCAASQFRLFPLGQSDDGFIFFELFLFRTCSTFKRNNVDFTWEGRARVVSLNKSTFKTIHTFDSLNFLECRCDMENIPDKSNYRQNLLPFYRKALEFCGSLKNFKLAKVIEIRNGPDSSVENSSLVSSVSKEKDTNISSIKLTSEYSLRRLRISEINSTTVFILTYENGQKLGKIEELDSLKKYCEVIPFYSETPRWHGTIIDYVYVSNKGFDKARKENYKVNNRK